MRKLLTVVAIFALATTGGDAFGSTIGITTGVFDFVTQPTLDGTMTFVPAVNASGQGVGVTNGVAQTYVLPPGYQDFAPVGRVGNIVYGNLGTSTTLFGATFNVATNTWTEQRAYQFTAAGPSGRFGAADAVSGMPVEGTITNTGAITNVIHIQTLAGTLSGDPQGIFGNTVTGILSDLNGGHAFCSDSGVLRGGIGSTGSAGYGVNGSTSACLGSMLSGSLNLATSWDLAGNASFFADLPGTGLFIGDAYSGYGNFTLLRDPLSTGYFINNGAKTITLPAFCTSFGFACNADAYLVGSGSMAELIAHGSVIQLTASLTELNQPFQTNTTPTPEPKTWALMGAGLLSLVGIRHRKDLKRFLSRKRVPLGDLQSA